MGLSTSAVLYSGSSGNATIPAATGSYDASRFRFRMTEGGFTPDDTDPPYVGSNSFPVFLKFSVLPPPKASPNLNYTISNINFWYENTIADRTILYSTQTGYFRASSTQTNALWAGNNSSGTFTLPSFSANYTSTDLVIGGTSSSTGTFICVQEKISPTAALLRNPVDNYLSLQYDEEVG